MDLRSIILYLVHLHLLSGPGTSSLATPNSNIIHLRYSRQVLMNPQMFPVRQAVLQIPLPTNIGFFPGPDAPTDICDRDEIIMEDGTCQDLLTDGNCKDTQEVLLDPKTNKGFCGQRLCPPDRVFVHSTQLCHDPRENGLCPPGRELFYSAHGTAVCSCPDLTVEGDDDLDDDVCELVLGKSLQCLPNQVFWFKDFKSPPQCLPDPCHGNNLKKAPTDLPFVPSKLTGKCYQIGQSQPACSVNYYFALSLDSLAGECVTLEDAGYNIFSNDTIAALRETYGTGFLSRNGNSAVSQPPMQPYGSGNQMNRPHNQQTIGNQPVSSYQQINNNHSHQNHNVMNNPPSTDNRNNIDRNHYQQRQPKRYQQPITNSMYSTNIQFGARIQKPVNHNAIIGHQNKHNSNNNQFQNVISHYSNSNHQAPNTRNHQSTQSNQQFQNRGHHRNSNSNQRLHYHNQQRNRNEFNQNQIQYTKQNNRGVHHQSAINRNPSSSNQYYEPVSIEIHEPEEQNEGGSQSFNSPEQSFNSPETFEPEDQQSIEMLTHDISNFGLRFIRSLGFLQDPRSGILRAHITVFPSGKVVNHKVPAVRRTTRNVITLDKSTNIRESRNAKEKILSRKKRTLYAYASPSNVFESRLLGCRSGSARDINGKCRTKILPSRIPKRRGTRAAPPVRPTPFCPPGMAFNIRRMCVPSTRAQNSLMAFNLG